MITVPAKRFILSSFIFTTVSGLALPSAQALPEHDLDFDQQALCFHKPNTQNNVSRNNVSGAGINPLGSGFESNPCSREEQKHPLDTSTIFIERPYPLAH